MNKLRRNFSLHLMLLPALLFLVIFSYIPIVGILMAFQNFRPALGFFRSEWIGLQNFEFIFKLPSTKRVIWNTTFIATMKIVAGILVPVCVALLLNEVNNLRFKRVLQTVVYFPHFLSWVVLSGILVDVLSPSTGIVNQVIGFFGGDPIYFLGDPEAFPYTMVLTESWKSFGFGTIVYLAALTGIDPNLYEAAEIDGANRLQQIRHITLTGIMPTVLLMTLLSLGNVLNAGFDQIFNLYSPQVYRTGDIIDTMVYRMGLVDARYGMATAMGLFKSVVSFFLIAISHTLAYKFTDYRVF